MWFSDRFPVLLPEHFPELGQGLGVELGDPAFGDIQGGSHFLHVQLFGVVQTEHQPFPFVQFIDEMGQLVNDVMDKDRRGRVVPGLVFTGFQALLLNGL